VLGNKVLAAPEEVVRGDCRDQPPSGFQCVAKVGQQFDVVLDMLDDVASQHAVG